MFRYYDVAGNFMKPLTCGEGNFNETVRWQLCGGQKAGCEAAAHAMRQIYEAEETDAVLFIDASNAFNPFSRQALLDNIRYLCPAIATYLSNCYSNF